MKFPPRKITKFPPQKNTKFPPTEKHAMKNFDRLPPLRNLSGKGSKYPPSNLRNYIDYPPSKSQISQENAPTTPPPRIYETTSTTPPSKSLRKTGKGSKPTTKLHRLPPLEISQENAPTTPPSNLRNFTDYPPLETPPRYAFPPHSMETR